jgi:hypothetical protein
MDRYGIPEDDVHHALSQPDETVPGHSGRNVAHKALDGYVLRVVYEEVEGLLVVVTVYRARRSRYAV